MKETVLKFWDNPTITISKQSEFMDTGYYIRITDDEDTVGLYLDQEQVKRLCYELLTFFDYSDPKEML